VSIAAYRTGTQRAFRQIVETSERERVSLRDAAYMIGIGRVAEASRLRGWV
jgi:glutamate dehydrogenase